jgi:7,8-dihydropterin-6-yl-methyl-4-(beta-D-ribofuranosyl)aminobenzene 5'-phosphate synthase
MNHDWSSVTATLFRLFGLASMLGSAGFWSIAGCPATDKKVPPATATQPPRREIVLTICYDNNPGRENLTPAWGFACVIQGLEKTILFDTGGDGRILLANMETLGIKPAQIDVVVLSHAHGDHTGGLWSFLDARGGVPVYLPTGFPATFGERVRRHGGQPIMADGPTPVCQDASTTGTMGKQEIPEQGLCVNTADGWVLITGCAHPGIANMAEQATHLVQAPLHLVIGGFHMGGASKEQIEAVIQRFKKLGIATAAPCHCSGDATRRLFQKEYGDGYTPACVGMSLHFVPKSRGEGP